LKILVVGTGVCGRALLESLLERGKMLSKVVIASSRPLRAAKFMHFYERGVDVEYLYVDSEDKIFEYVGKEFDAVIVSDLDTQRCLVKALDKALSVGRELLLPYLSPRHTTAESYRGRELVLGYCDVARMALSISRYYHRIAGPCLGIEILMEASRHGRDHQLSSILAECTEIDIDSLLGRLRVRSSLGEDPEEISIEFVISGVNVRSMMVDSAWLARYVPCAILLNFNEFTVEISRRCLGEYLRGRLGAVFLGTRKGDGFAEGFKLLSELVSLGARVRVLPKR